MEIHRVLWTQGGYQNFMILRFGQAVMACLDLQNGIEDKKGIRQWHPIAAMIELKSKLAIRQSQDGTQKFTFVTCGTEKVIIGKWMAFILVQAISEQVAEKPQISCGISQDGQSAFRCRIDCLFEIMYLAGVRRDVFHLAFHWIEQPNEPKETNNQTQLAHTNGGKIQIRRCWKRTGSALSNLFCSSC